MGAASAPPAAVVVHAQNEQYDYRIKRRKRKRFNRRRRVTAMERYMRRA